MKSNYAENSALHRRNKLHFKIYWNRKQLLWIVKYFTILLILLCFWLNKCSLGEHDISMTGFNLNLYESRQSSSKKGKKAPYK